MEAGKEKGKKETIIKRKRWNIKLGNIGEF